MQNITCPWCGYEYTDSLDFIDDEGILKCRECGRVFRYERFHIVEYRTWEV